MFVSFLFSLFLTCFQLLFLVNMCAPQDKEKMMRPKINERRIKATQYDKANKKQEQRLKNVGYNVSAFLLTECIHFYFTSKVANAQCLLMGCCCQHLFPHPCLLYLSIPGELGHRHRDIRLRRGAARGHGPQVLRREEAAAQGLDQEAREPRVGQPRPRNAVERGARDIAPCCVYVAVRVFFCARVHFFW